MSISTYWQLDVSDEPQRSELSTRPALPSLVSAPRGGSQNRYGYYAQVAQAASQASFDGIFLPYRREADESRIVAAVVARAAPQITVIPEFPASVGSAVYTSKQAVSFQRATNGRLAWAIAPLADAQTRAAEGDYLAEEQLGERLDEFLTVARGVHASQPFSFTGEHFEVRDGGFAAPLNRVPFPTVFLQGDSEEELSLSAQHADVHLFTPAPLGALAPLIETLDGLAHRVDRTVAFGLIQPVLVREDGEEARYDAARTALQPDTLVGSYDEIAAQLAEYAALGITHFILSARPSLEEAYRVGRHLLPRLRALTTTIRTAA